jgi:hypothetical protein
MGQKYKALIKDNTINFYDVCEEAESYFSQIDIHAKGSGWKGYQRWKNANEYKYFPSGDRSNEDPFFVQHAFEDFKGDSPELKSSFDNGWNELGPRFIDSITGHYSAGLGRIEDFYVDPNNDNRIYLGSRSGGFWKTTNGGLDWEVTTDFLFATGVDAIAVSPTNPDSVLINVRNANNGYSHGIYRSTDGGDNWSLSNFNPNNVGHGGLGDNFRIYKIAYHPTIPNLIFIGTSKGIYRSTDNLQTWSSQITSGDITEIDFHPTDPNYVYLYDDYYWGANQNVVLTSNNAGVSYTSSSTIVGNNDASGKLSVSNDCSDCVYFASDNGVWRSQDKGQIFNFISNPSQSCDGYAVNDLDTNYSIYGYLDLVASSDGGANYTQKTYWSFGSTPFDGGEYIHADLRNAKSINGVFYVATDGLLCKSSNNGDTWEILSQGTGIRENYKLGTSQSNHFRTISGSQDNGTSIKVKDTWIEFYGADGMEGLIHPLNDDWMMGSVQYGSRRRTTTGGQSQSGATPPNTQDAAWEAPITYDPNNQMHLFDFRDSIWKSEDFGNSWTYLGKPSSFNGSINQSAIAENNSEIILISKSSDLEKSTDGGLTFNNITNNLPNAYIEDIAFNPKDDNNIFVVYAKYQNDGEKIFMSEDGGNSWTNVTYNIGNMPLHSVVIDMDGNIYVGGEIGVYTMHLNDGNWSLYNPNLPNTTVEELEICNGSNTLKAATWGRGLFEYTLVDKNDYPSILTTSITDMPTASAPKEGVDQFVTSTISYDNTITETYVLWSINSLGFNNRIEMTNTADTTWISDNALPSGVIGDKVYFKILTVGSNEDTSATYKFMYEVKPYQYCQSAGDATYNGSMTLVSFGDIQNITGKTQPYTDYSSSEITDLITGDDYQLTVNINTDNGNYTYYSTVWIDWNSDSDFDDIGERYNLGSTTNNSDGPTDLSPLAITIPTDAHTGPTRMRVSCKYNGYPEACDIGIDGEVEDYGINIISVASATEKNFLAKLYPNPAKEILNIEFLPGYNNGSIQILDARGKTMIKDIWVNCNTKQLNIGTLAKGVYIVNLSSGIDSSTTKLIIE